MGVFRGLPSGPKVYLYREVAYMAAVGLGHTSMPSVWNNGVEFAFAAASEETLVAPWRRGSGCTMSRRKRSTFTSH